MRHDFIDRYSRIDSPIHRIAAPIKSAVIFVAVFSTIVTPFKNWIPFTTIFIFYVSVLLFSHIPPKYILHRLLMVEPFVLGVALLTLLKPDGGTTFWTVILKSSLSVFGLILYSNTTPFSEILRLLRRLKVPGLLVTVLALMYRYLFVLIDETERMQRARTSRTFTTRKFYIWRMRGEIIGQLFIRSTERAERIYSAMRARGWK